MLSLLPAVCFLFYAASSAAAFGMLNAEQAANGKPVDLAFSARIAIWGPFGLSAALVMTRGARNGFLY